MAAFFVTKPAALNALTEMMERGRIRGHGQF
jgi:hypothetical protein